MLGLQQMSDVMKMSADTIEDIYGDCGVTPPADTQRLIDDLRRLAQQAGNEPGHFPTLLGADGCSRGAGTGLALGRRWRDRQRQAGPDIGARRSLTAVITAAAHDRLSLTASELDGTAAPKTIDGDQDGGSLEHFDQPVEQAFVIVLSGLKVFFENALGIADCLNCQFLIAHRTKLPATKPGTQLKSTRLVPEGTGAFLTAGCCVSAGNRRANPRGCAAVRGAFQMGKECRKRASPFPWLPSWGQAQNSSQARS